MGALELFLENSIVGAVALVALWLQYKSHRETAERLHERLMALESEIKELIKIMRDKN